MSHPHQFLLEEFNFAIEHFALTVPEEIRKEAQETLDRFSDDSNVTRSEIKAAMYQIGLKTYPYRHACRELVGKDKEKKLQEIILAQLGDRVKGLVQSAIDKGEGIREFVKSDVFQKELTAEERQKIGEVIINAKEHASDFMKQLVQEKKHAHDELVAKWEVEAQKIREGLLELSALAEKESVYQEEIQQKVDQFQEGFLSTERDPELDQVRNAIEYWEGVLKEGM